MGTIVALDVSQTKTVGHSMFYLFPYSDKIKSKEYKIISNSNQDTKSSVNVKEKTFDKFRKQEKLT